MGTIVYHVAAHEIGHAIYSLDSVRDIIKVSTKTLLEEPRAELTALHTLRLLLNAGLVDLVRVIPCVEERACVHVRVRACVRAACGVRGVCEWAQGAAMLDQHKCSDSLSA